MTNFNPSAQERICFYESRFRNESTSQLAENFSSLAKSRGWTAERSFYSTALVNELQRRGVDISEMCGNENGNLVVRYMDVAFDEDKNSLYPIKK